MHAICLAIGQTFKHSLANCKIQSQPTPPLNAQKTYIDQQRHEQYPTEEQHSRADVLKMIDRLKAMSIY